MAAGQGFKTFTTGEVLTAGDVNGYLMQGINVFASSAARAAAITSPQEGQYSFLKDTNALEYYDGAAWVGAPVGDITAVTAGTGISGGGSSGDVTITNSMATAIDAKGDLIAGTGADAFSRIAVGANDTVLTADSTTATGLKWATPAAGGAYTLLSTTTLSGTTTTVSSISSSYKHLFFMIRGVGAGSNTFAMRTNGISTTNYYGFTQTVGNGFANAVSWSNGNTAMEFNGSIAANNSNNSFGWIYDYSNAAVPFKMTTHQLYADGNDKWMQTNFVNRGLSTNAINSVTFLSPGGGTISGTLLIYGVN